ncbi:phoE Broad specificity phosphatase PhoE and related phosphatases [Mycobacteriaceae bacterium]|jgi:broad specificity phosphatase PhoE
MYVSRKISAAVAAPLVMVMLAACGTSSPPEARDVTLTFIRHAESEANAAEIASTTVPGPPLTPVGQEQAAALADRLSGEGFDGIYASEMVRTQQSAAPLSKAMGEQVTVLPGLNEIPAGWFEGIPVADTSGTFLLGPQAWLKGDRRFGIPGSEDGDEFNGAFTNAVQKIYESGDDKPIAFSSGLAVMMWTLMNARNGKQNLLTDHPLPNTGRVVLTGNPTMGWTLISWDGITNFSLDD